MSEFDRQALADAFNREIDPLAKHGPTFEEVDIDVFDLFIEDVLKPEDPVPKTVKRVRTNNPRVVRVHD